MKTAIFSVFVILLSMVGAHALASDFDLNVENNTIKTTDTTAGDNGVTGEGGGEVIRER